MNGDLLTTRPSLRDRLQDQAYQGYAYAYPHKTAYRHFSEPIPLRDLWQGEDRSSLYLYIHLPFCEMRCGFCNLFTTTNPGEGRVSEYLEALARQMECLGEALGPDFRFSRGAVGGGTPSFLTNDELETLFDAIDRYLGALPEGMPLSFELSPGTVTDEKLGVLRTRGVTRLSMGVQSFIESETRALGRPQSLPGVHRSLEAMRNSGVPVMNIDLIYGAGIQTIDSWIHSLKEAIAYQPEELYLYPLYVRPLTGLERIGRQPSDQRLELYRKGREWLLENGYEQISMRLFRRRGILGDDAGLEGPVYCCQEDGMVGLGAGARSYTRDVHYCTEYAVGRSGINEIIDDFIRRSDREHRHAVYGCRLTMDEQKRRFLLKSLLRRGGLELARYGAAYGSSVFDDFPELTDLFELRLAEEKDGRIELNALGLERSDTIGPWLFSTEVVSRMSRYELS